MENVHKETKRDRFIRIAESRTNRIIDTVRLLGNLSNRANYDYTEEDLRKIFTSIDKELKVAKSKFTFEDIEDRFSLK